MSVGTNIKRKRQEIGISQTKLAEAIGVKQPMIAMIERGSKIPSIVLGRDIAAALGCSVENLLEEN